MNAAAALSFDHSPRTSSPITNPAANVPEELLALFEESAKVKASFYRLAERDRRGFLDYIEGATSPSTRERRAAIIAMSLIGLARDLKDENVGLRR
jgi:uncharacterized protein YdeI (YjbR/CyaY-like superfamily)